MMSPSPTSTESTSHVYEGPERRRHRVFVTHHSEYHCRDGVCVAVRDRRRGVFVQGHSAIGRHITGSVRFNDNGGIAAAHDPIAPQVGEQLCFSSDELDDPGNILTSELDDIVRPPKETVDGYPH